MSDEIGNLLAKRFIQRRDVKAWQQPNGSYLTDRTPITRADLRAHVSCERTLGHYLLGQDDCAKFFCFDIDLAKDGVWDDEPIKPREEFANPNSPHREGLVGQLVIMAESLARCTHRLYDEIPVAIAFSGSKGVHVYGLTGPAPGIEVRAAAMDVINQITQIKPLRGDNFFRHENPEMSVEIEVFPKQASLEGKDLGNLLRLPLGRNQKGKEGIFLRCGGGKRASFHPMDPLDALSGEQLPWKT